MPLSHDGGRSRPISFVLSSHEGKLGTAEFGVEFHFGVWRHVLVDLSEIAGHGIGVELIFCRVIHQGSLVLNAIPSPLVHFTWHILVPTLTSQFDAFVARVELQQG